MGAYTRRHTRQRAAGSSGALLFQLLFLSFSLSLFLSFSHTSLPRLTDNGFDAGLIKAIRAQPRLQSVAIAGIAEVVAPFTSPRVDLQHTKKLFTAKGFDNIIAKPATALTAAAMAAFVEQCIQH